MKVKVEEKIISKITDDEVLSGEVNVTNIDFEFSLKWDNLIKVAIFIKGDKSYRVVIENDKCSIPSFDTEGNVLFGVYGYAENEGNLTLRLSPSPIKFYVGTGSYKKETEEQEISLNDYERYIVEVKKIVSNSGSGTNNYADLNNKPTLNGEVIEGDKTSEDYHISASVVPENLKDTEIELDVVTSEGGYTEKIKRTLGQWLDNDNKYYKYVMSVDSETGKENIVYFNFNGLVESILGMYNDLQYKQDELTAGENITIENNVISATVGTNSASPQVKMIADTSLTEGVSAINYYTCEDGTPVGDLDEVYISIDNFHPTSNGFLRVNIQNGSTTAGKNILYSTSAGSTAQARRVFVKLKKIGNGFYEAHCISAIQVAHYGYSTANTYGYQQVEMTRINLGGDFNADMNIKVWGIKR